MASSILDMIESPADVKGLSYTQLKQLAFELRAEMVAATSVRGGHLSPSLGATELIIALHRVLNCPKDKLVFDVGHQAYAHKLLTGRREAFSDLRTMGGISGFPKIDESPYDAHDSGHASDSLSTALGYALARDMNGSDEKVVAVVGDASFTGGMSFEALNHLGQLSTPLVIVLNDNGMSINPNVGAFAKFLGTVRLSDAYIKVRDHVEETMNTSGPVGRFLMDRGNDAKETFKKGVMPEGMFFEYMGITYIGPIDGHDIRALETILKGAVEVDGPVIIHAVTTKGKGYSFAEAKPDRFHGIAPFHINSGELKKASSAPSWTKVFSEALLEQAEKRDDIVAITAAMSDGTGLAAFEKAHPNRFYDVGIAEEHAVTLASSLAMGGFTPVVAIYSTFLQRAFDQMIINVALQKQHVVFCLDRAGVVGEDGPTHHGIFDLSYLRLIPGMTILAPSDAEELKAALDCALNLEGPVAIRYPRGSATESLASDACDYAVAHARQLTQGSDVALLAVGSMVTTALEVAEQLKESGTNAAVFDMRSVKPLDVETLKQVADYPLVVTLEENTRVGGFGSAVLEEYAAMNMQAHVMTLGFEDCFVEQGTQAELKQAHGLDAASITEKITKAL